MGPYNPLDKQLRYDPETGEVLEWYVEPYNQPDRIAAYHDICYSMGKNKRDCDREIVVYLNRMFELTGSLCIGHPRIPCALGGVLRDQRSVLNLCSVLVVIL